MTGMFLLFPALIWGPLGIYLYHIVVRFYFAADPGKNSGLQSSVSGGHFVLRFQRLDAVWAGSGCASSFSGIFCRYGNHLADCTETNS